LTIHICAEVFAPEFHVVKNCDQILAEEGALNVLPRLTPLMENCKIAGLLALRELTQVEKR
jgi:hypothetical protein